FHEVLGPLFDIGVAEVRDAKRRLHAEAAGVDVVNIGVRGIVAGGFGRAGNRNEDFTTAGSPARAVRGKIGDCGGRLRHRAGNETGGQNNRADTKQRRSEFGHGLLPIPAKPCAAVCSRISLKSGLSCHGNSGISEIRLCCYRHTEVEKAEIPVVLGADHLAERLLSPLIAYSSRPWLVEGVRIVHRNSYFQLLSLI